MKAKGLVVVILLAAGVVAVYVLLARGMMRKKVAAPRAAPPADHEAAREAVEGDAFEYVVVRKRKEAPPARFAAPLPRTADEARGWQDDDERYPPKGWFSRAVCAGEPHAVERLEPLEPGVAWIAIGSCTQQGICEAMLRKLAAGDRSELVVTQAGLCTGPRWDAMFEDPRIPDGVVIDRRRNMIGAREHPFSPRLVVAVKQELELDTGYLVPGIVALAEVKDPRAVDALLELHRKAPRDVRATIALALEGNEDPRAEKIYEAECRRDPDREECWTYTEGRDRVPTAPVDLEVCATTPGASSNYRRMECLDALRALDPARAARAAKTAVDVVDEQAMRVRLLTQARFRTPEDLASHLVTTALLTAPPDLSPRWGFPTATELLVAEGRGVRLARAAGASSIDHTGALAGIARAAGLTGPAEAPRDGERRKLRYWDGTTRWEADSDLDEHDELQFPHVSGMVGFVNAIHEAQGSETRCTIDDNDYDMVIVCGPRHPLMWLMREELL